MWYHIFQSQWEAGWLLEKSSAPTLCNIHYITNQMTLFYLVSMNQNDIHIKDGASSRHQPLGWDPTSCGHICKYVHVKYLQNRLCRMKLWADFYSMGRTGSSRHGHITGQKKKMPALVCISRHVILKSNMKKTWIAVNLFPQVESQCSEGTVSEIIVLVSELHSKSLCFEIRKLVSTTHPLLIRTAWLRLVLPITNKFFHHHEEKEFM